MTKTDKVDSDLVQHTKILLCNRKKSRKLFFQKLYSMSMNTFDEDLFKKSFFDDIFTFKIDEKYILEMTKIVICYECFFITILKKYSPKFDISKMSLLYTLPIYIWLAEMFFLSEEIPWKVSINEAVEIAKIYWNDSSKKIVNWVLDKAFKDNAKIEKIKNNDFSIEKNKIFN